MCLCVHSHKQYIYSYFYLEQMSIKINDVFKISIYGFIKEIFESLRSKFENIKMEIRLH
jgi:hypothetical protein